MVENDNAIFSKEAHKEHTKKEHLEQKIKDTSFEIYDYEHDLSMKLDDLINKKNWKDLREERGKTEERKEREEREEIPHKVLKRKKLKKNSKVFERLY